MEGLRIEEVDLDALHDSQHFHATGITPALSEDNRNAVLDTVQLACKAGVRVSFDINYRSKLWAPQRAREVLSTIIPGIHLLFIKETDLALLWDRRGDAETELRSLQEEFGSQYSDTAVTASVSLKIISRVIRLLLESPSAQSGLGTPLPLECFIL